MPTELKIAGIWAAYVVGLMLTSAAAYVFFPASPRPSLTLVAEPDGFGKGDIVTVRARLDAPAPRPIAVDIDLGGEALIGQDYDVDEPNPVPLRFAIGERESPPLVLRKRPPASAAGQGEPRVESSKIVVSARVPDDAGVSFDQAAIGLPIEVTRFGPPPPPYVVSIQGTGDAFHDRADKVTITFSLDRPVSKPISLEYRLTGSARQATDYTVSGPSRNHQVRFAPDQASASIVLERRPDAQSRRGEGDREIDITFVPSSRFTAGPVNSWRVRLPDPRADLSWAIAPSGKLDASKTSDVKVQLTLSAPRKDPVSVEYQVSADPDVALQGPSGAADGPRTLRIEPGQLSAEDAYRIAGGDAIGGPPRHVRFSPRAVVPPDLKGPEKLGEIELTLADDRPLPGQMLVLLVWNDDMTRSGKVVLDELAAFTKVRGDKLVGGSVLVLSADRSIRRTTLDPASLKLLKPFPADADPDGVLEAAVKSVAERIAPRVQGNPPVTLVWQDYGNRAAVGVGKERFSGFPAGSAWDIFWIGPPPDRSRLAKMLQDAFPSSDGKPRFHSLEDPAKRLSGSLSGRLRSTP